MSVINPFRPLKSDDDGSAPLSRADIREIAERHVTHRTAVMAFNAAYGDGKMTTELLSCPFCGGGLVRSETFSTRTAEVQIHDNKDCFLHGTIICLSDRDDDVERVKKWNRRI